MGLDRLLAIHQGFACPFVAPLVRQAPAPVTFQDNLSKACGTIPYFASTF
jgi:hypothetical protein